MTGSAAVPTGTDNMLAETDGSREALAACRTYADPAYM